jgi:hypothetical protein
LRSLRANRICPNLKRKSSLSLRKKFGKAVIGRPDSPANPIRVSSFDSDTLSTQYPLPLPVNGPSPSGPVPSYPGILLPSLISLQLSAYSCQQNLIIVEPHGQEPVAPAVRRNPPKLQSSFAKASEDTRIPPRSGDRGFLRRRVNDLINQAFLRFLFTYCPAGTLFFRGERIQCPVFCITRSKGGRRTSSKLSTKEGRLPTRIFAARLTTSLC